MATLRQIRHNNLLASGFLPFEAWQLSKTPFSYKDASGKVVKGALAYMAKDRAKEWIAAGKPNPKGDKWAKQIYKKYEDNRCLYDKNGNWLWGKEAAWVQYRAYERQWRAAWEKRHPGKTAPKPPSPHQNPESRKKYRELNKQKINDDAKKYRNSEYGKKVRRDYKQAHKLTKRDTEKRLRSPMSDSPLNK